MVSFEAPIDRGTPRQTAVCLQLRGTEPLRFALQPQGFWKSNFSWVGEGDINFDSHPKFFANYLLRGDDENAIRELFNDDVLKFYEEHSGLYTECSENKLHFYRDGIREEPENIQAFLQLALRLRALFEKSIEYT